MKLQKLCIFTSINHNPNHCFRVPDGAAPEQDVAAVEADSNPIGVLSVKHTHTVTHRRHAELLQSSFLQLTTHMKPLNRFRSLLGFSHSMRLWKFSGLNCESCKTKAQRLQHHGSNIQRHFTSETNGKVKESQQKN